MQERRGEDLPAHLKILAVDAFAVVGAKDACLEALAVPACQAQINHRLSTQLPLCFVARQACRQPEASSSTK